VRGFPACMSRAQSRGSWPFELNLRASRPFRRERICIARRMVP